MKTFGEQLAAHDGKGPGFDVVRVVLALAVLLFHVPVMVGGYEPDPWTPSGLIFPTLLPVFFAVSGFLVMGSAMRVDEVGKFIQFRILRIVPALLVDVVLCAFVLGSLFTVRPLTDYYADKDFWSYFLNIIGRIKLFLPGVFESNPNKAVNGSLWTIQPELICYAAMALLMLRKAHRSRNIVVGAFLFSVVLATSLDFLINPTVTLDMGAVSQFRLFTYFLCGGALFHLRYRVPYSPVIMIVSLIVGLFLMQIPIARVLATPLLTYVVISLLSGEIGFQIW